MKKIVTIFCAVLLLLTMGVGASFAGEKELIRIVDPKFSPPEWPETTIRELMEKRETNLWVWCGPVQRSLFYREYPNIEVDGISGWGFYGSLETTLTGIAGGTAPSYYYMGSSTSSGPQEFINQAAAADITDFVKNWNQVQHIPQTVWDAAWRSGRCYGIPSYVYSHKTIAYRKDWFREAGIFNARGEPAPADDWTWDDLIEIAKKLTDTKAKRWGFESGAETADGRIQSIFSTFAIPMVQPDPTGKYTWQAGFNAPIGVEALQMIKDLVWKYKVSPAMVQGWRDTRTDYHGGRAGMLTYEANHSIGAAGTDAPSFGEGTIYKEIGGMAPYPKGPYGVRTSLAAVNLWAINPTQTEEQIEATFNYLDFMLAGKGWRVRAMTKVDLFANAIDLSPYKVEGLYDWKDKLSKLFPDYGQTISVIESDPVGPSMSVHGLYIPNSFAFDQALQAALSKILTDVNADPKAELDKAANIANKTALNVKLEGVTKTDLKDYYTALVEFYKVNFPNYYDKVFKNLYETYAKVW